MATVLDIETDALIDLGVLAAGETPTAADSSFALRALNRLIDLWKGERLFIYQLTRTTWTITANDGSYTVGSGADVNIARPMSVDHVNLIDTSTDPDTEHPLGKLTDDEYARIPQKALTSPWPSRWYYNPTFANATLTLWPVPTSSTLQGALYAPQAVAEFDAISDTVTLPPGYRELLVTNLAVRLAPSYGRQVTQELGRAAQEAKFTVKRANIRPDELTCGADVPGMRGNTFWDIHTGDFR